MEVNFVDENAWKNKDIALAYQYTTGSSPAIEKDKATFNWTNELLELRYSDQTDASTQQWQFFKVKKNRLCHKYRGYSTFSNYSGRNKGNKTKCYQKRICIRRLVYNRRFSDRNSNSQ